MQNLVHFASEDGDGMFISKRQKKSHFCPHSAKFTLFKLNDVESFKLGIFHFAGAPVSWH
jgi:hypothetical protein